ncbi:MAG: alpha/beta hydrolase [Micavibrio sp.]|nr:MAG: alpha/beta hydrolase [Micavibrio sp.]
MKERWKKPDGFQWGTFQNDDGAKIRYGCAEPKDKKNIKGTIAILPGFRETAEKYFETVNDFLDRGYAVWVMDWRGQGGSERYLPNDPQKSHSEGFDAQVRDLKQFIDTVVKPVKEKPLLLAAHSMGGHLAMRYLKEHPGKIDGAMITAPMFDIKTGALPRHIARTLAKHATSGSKGEKYIPGGKDWQDGAFEGNKHTHDETRFNLTQELFKNNPHLQTGDPSYRWVHEAFRSIDILTEETYLRAIDVPLLMATAGQDETVDVAAQDRAAKMLTRCRQITYPDARHEIWVEKDEIRNDWLDKCDAFLKQFDNKKKLARDFDGNARKHDKDWKGAHPPTPHSPRPRHNDNDDMPPQDGNSGAPPSGFSGRFGF